MIFGRRRSLRWDGTTGTPRSGNGASSFHLSWVVPAGGWIEAEAELEVLVVPSVPRLAFWAMQVSFTDRGRHGGAGHLGLQWYPPHPGSTAVNWGGYGPSGGELDGTGSTLPSATRNDNTRDLAWRPGRRYLLRVTPGTSEPPPGLRAWRGEVVDLVDGSVSVVRELWAAGSHLVAPMVWSEVFADCDDPGSSVRWSGLRLRSDEGEIHEVVAVSVNYQTVGDGGCLTTDVGVDGRGVVQTTGTARTTAQGATLALPPQGLRPA